MKLFALRLTLLVIFASGCSLFRSETKGDSSQSLIRDFVSRSESNAWIITKNGELFSTKNKGGIWENITKPAIKGAVAISFINESEGWLLRGKGEVWHSTDSGQSWTKLIAVVGSDFDFPYRVDFLDRQRGWVSSSDSVWRTTDGGDTWQKVLSASVESQYISSNFCLVTTANGKMFRTDNNARDWYSYQITDTNTGNDDIHVCFIDSRIGWVASYPNGFLSRTDDGGKTWYHRPKIESSSPLYIRSVYFLSESEGWAAAMNDHHGVLLHTKNNGQTWQAIETAIDEPYFDRLFFENNTYGWLLGKNSLYLTEDAGKSWRITFSVKK